MAEVLKVPKIRETVSEIVINSWAVNEGDMVTKGQVIAQFESDKANFEYESPMDGTILEILAGEGQTLKVGDPLATIG